MPVISDDEQRSYRAKSCLPKGLRRRSQRGPRDFCRGLLALVSLFWIPLVAQEAGAPIIIDGREILRVYAPLGQFTPAERAEEIQHRIVALAEKGFMGPLRTTPSDKATAVFAGPVIVMNVTDADAAPENVERAVLAQRYAVIVQNAIENYRTDHNWGRLALSAGKALLIWVLFYLVVWALVKAVSWLDRRLQHWLSRIESASGANRFYLLVWDRARFIVTVLVKGVAVLTAISAFSFLLSYTFSMFPQTAGISLTLMDHLRSTFGAAALAFVNYLPSGAFVIVLAFLTRYILNILKFVATAVEQGDLTITGMHPEMAKPTYQLARVAVILFALVVAFPYLPGGQSDAFKGISIFVGVVLSLGSSSAVGNVLAGLVLTYMRPFRIGDRVKIVDTTGDIVERSLLVTRVLTIKNVEVVIPNGAILGSPILNYSALARTKGLILHTTVTIGYDAPWRTVHELLMDAALATEGILEQPRPFVLETSLNDFHISYELNAYTDRPNDMIDIYSHLHEAIQDSFNKRGVEIMSPTFYALRDGNTMTIPADHRPPGYEAPSFRVRDPGITPPSAATSSS